MFGWKHRTLFPSHPFFLPGCIHIPGRDFSVHSYHTMFFFLLCVVLTFSLATAVRFLELPFWDSSAYRVDDAFLMATHDAYHWIAGAEGFEFGAGHPMSELLRILANWTGFSTANVAFWLPPFMGSCLAICVFMWGWGLGFPYAGVCAGVLASLSPGFFARTLLGFYDTDLVVLLFAVLLGLVPAMWVHPWLASIPDAVVAWWNLWRKKRRGANQSARRSSHAAKRPLVSLKHAPAPLTDKAGWHFLGKNTFPAYASQTPLIILEETTRGGWICCLALAGLFGHWMQEWHSLFPYLVRYSALLLPALILFLGPIGGRKALLHGALCYSLPVVMGWSGAFLSLCYVAGLRWLVLPAPLKIGAELHEKVTGLFNEPFFQKKIFFYLLWILVFVFVVDVDVFATMVRSFFAYVNRSGDIAALPETLHDPLIYPSVTQSIIEVQTINLHELTLYTYPIKIVTYICLAAFFVRLLLSPVFFWFIPLVGLSFLSVSMGGRMTMFGPPVLMLAFCIEGGMLLEILFFRIVFPAFKRGSAQAQAQKWSRFLSPMKIRFPGKGNSLRGISCVALTLLLIWPLISLLPRYSQGPIISQEQAEALRFLQEATPEESIIWNWWDWGYATHYFSRRITIADGARHGGPSLYLPAAVYATSDPRFARQIIKHTATKGNIPGNVFQGMSASQAQELMDMLAAKETPLIEAEGKQYLVVSFDLLRIGLWVTRYGTWDFTTQKTSGALMNNLSQALQFNLGNGIIAPAQGKPVSAGTIDLFEREGLTRRNYKRPGSYHFIFNPPLEDVVATDIVPDFLHNFWEQRYGAVSLALRDNDKIAVDDAYYNTMLVQLLLCNPKDPAIAPYFSLVFDNVYTRVYEVR